MGTIVTIDVPAHAASLVPQDERQELVDRAFDWFREIERVCTRFDPESELMQLTRTPGVPVVVSALLFQIVRFALTVAEESGGAFDPTVGHRMEAAGFSREHRRGHLISTPIVAPGDTCYRDLHIDDAAGSITLLRPLVLDVGAVAKGMAIDVAARELAPLEHFVIDAGGDLYLAGRTADDAPWSVGIRHPERDDRLLESVHVSDQAVCTSGNYERRNVAGGVAPHILDPRTGAQASRLVSATVISPSAMLADALATASFVLGPVDGLRLLETHGVHGLLFNATLERFATQGFDNDGFHEP
jgi:thiamine biosynthesis lipoprotein